MNQILLIGTEIWFRTDKKCRRTDDAKTISLRLRREITTIVRQIEELTLVVILLSAPLVCFCSQVAYIANNLGPDQTAPY